MKKITLALCACAFALTGLLASCSNESTSANYINRGYSNSNYKYAVSGTIESTSSNSYKNGADKDVVTKETSTQKIENGFVTVKWSKNENTETNYTSYQFNGSAIVTEASGTKSKTVDGKSQSGTTSSGSTDGAFSFNGWTIVDVEGTKYIGFNNGELLKIEDLAISEDEDAFSGDFGDEFALNIKVSTKDVDLEYSKENAAKATNESTTTYKLTFQLVESYEPAEAEAEEE